MKNNNGTSPETMEDKRLKEIIYQAVQATKKENSGVFLELKDRLGEINVTLNRLNDQIIRQNGRVNTAEKKIIDIETKWQKAVYGFIAILVSMIAFLLVDKFF